MATQPSSITHDEPAAILTRSIVSIKTCRLIAFLLEFIYYDEIDKEGAP
jgi:hypothetical protein